MNEINYHFAYILGEGKPISLDNSATINLSPINQRLLYVQAIENANNNIYSNNQNLRQLIKLSGVAWGIAFDYKGANYPIIGFEGRMTERQRLINREFEYEVYCREGIQESVETEDVYSVDKKEFVTIIKHNADKAIQFIQSL